MLDELFGQFVFDYAPHLLFGFVLFGYLVFAHTISHEIRAEWARKREEMKTREREDGEDVCLERMMVDISIFVCWVFFPIMLLSQWMFCKNTK
jgi:hypothetical protein